MLWRGDNVLWIRRRRAQPTVRYWLATWLGESDAILNRRYRHLKFHVLDRTLQVEIDVPAMPFVAAHLRAMIDLAAEVIEDLTPDVALAPADTRSTVSRHTARPTPRDSPLHSGSARVHHRIGARGVGHTAGRSSARTTSCSRTFV